VTLQSLKNWATALKRDVLALWIAARSSQTPLIARIGAGAVAAYALSPIDLIPDFIPVIGYLDDLLIVPLGIAIVVRLIPPPLMAQFRALAATRLSRPSSTVAAVLIVMLWIGACAVMVGLWQASRT